MRLLSPVGPRLGVDTPEKPHAKTLRRKADLSQITQIYPCQSPHYQMGACHNSPHLGVDAHEKPHAKTLRRKADLSQITWIYPCQSPHYQLPLLDKRGPGGVDATDRTSIIHVETQNLASPESAFWQRLTAGDAKFCVSTDRRIWQSTLYANFSEQRHIELTPILNPSQPQRLQYSPLTLRYSDGLYLIHAHG